MTGEELVTTMKEMQYAIKTASVVNLYELGYTYYMSINDFRVLDKYTQCIFSADCEERMLISSTIIFEGFDIIVDGQIPEGKIYFIPLPQLPNPIIELIPT